MKIQKIARLIGFVIVVSSARGFDRLNHMHSDSNQKTVQDAKDMFEAAVSDNIGIGPTLLTNLDAQIGLMSTVGQNSIKVSDSDLFTSLSETTWNGLRGQFLRQVGISYNDTYTNLQERDEKLNKAQGELDVRITVRILQVQSIAKILEALTKAETLLANQANEQVAAATRAISNGIPQRADGVSTNISQVITDFRNAIVKAGQQATAEPQVRNNLTALQKTVLSLVASSRDPASIYALVAVTDCGLTENSAVLLTNFLSHLNQELNQKVSVASLSDVKLVAAQPTSTSNLKSNQVDFINYLESAVASVTDASNPSKSARSLNLSDLTSILNELPAISKDMDKALEALNLHTEALDELLKTPQAFSNSLSLFTAASGNASSNDKAAFLLTNLLPAKAAQQFSSKEFQNAIHQVGSIINDIQNESQAANIRLLTFFSDITRSELALYQENVRHYQALNHICAQELKRWQSIQRLNGRFHDLYTPASAVWRPPTNSPTTSWPPNHPKIILFSDGQFLDWHAYYTWALTNDYADRRLAPSETDYAPPPIIKADDQILPSIRLLAENARTFQRASPSKSDPLGVYTLWSYQRLYAGVHLISGYTLMIGVNERMEQENTQLLAREVKEHDILLDGIFARTTEADLRLGIGDQLAFHSTGITSDDISTVFDVVQSALLSWIGAKL